MNQEELRKIKAVEDHARSFQKIRYVYPVISRRSGGLSLGVNLNPDRRCSFDCIYCEVDRSGPLDHPLQGERVDLVQLKEELSFLIEEAQSGRLAQVPKFADAGELTRLVKDIAFSGDGEPTLSSSFPGAVQVVGELKKHYGLEASQVVLITNATCLRRGPVLEAIEQMMHQEGRVWAKLDAGTEAYYQKINRSEVPLERILDNIAFAAARLPLTIQTMFLKLDGQSMSEEELEAYCTSLSNLLRGGAKLERIQAYTLARPAFGLRPGGGTIAALCREELEDMRSRIQSRLSLPVDCYA